LPSCRKGNDLKGQADIGTRPQGSGPAGRASGRRRGALAGLLAAVVVTLVYAMGGLSWFENGLGDGRFSLLDRPASGGVIVVAIDPGSIERLGAWPWPRGHHARVIDTLLAAGAARVAMDIDFSSPSEPAADAALVQAITRAGNRVVLPVFKQWADFEGVNLTHSEPMEALRQSALLAAVNVRPAGDGLIREYERYITWHGDLLPTMAVRLADREARRLDPFGIDFSISPTSVPVIPYADVLDGRFDAAAVRGRIIIVGSTAVELGDQLAVPRYRALPGAMLQALATESILLDRAIQRAAWPAVLLLALIVALLLGPFLADRTWRSGLVSALVTSLALPVAAVVVQASYAVSFDVSPAVTTTWLVFAAVTVQRLDLQSFEIFKNWMSAQHRQALMSTVVDDNLDGIIVVNHEHRIERMNAAAGRLLGLDSHDVTGHQIETVFPVDSVLAQLRQLAQSETGPYGNLPLETDVPCADGRTLNAEVSVSRAALKPGQGAFERRHEVRIYTVVTFRDISLRKAAQRALTVAAEKARDADRTKAQFVASVSHELRTPLNAIRGLSEVLQQQLHGDLGDTRYLEYANDLITNSHHLQELVEDLLTVSRIDAGGFEIRDGNLDVAALVNVSLRMLTADCRSAGHVVANEIPETLPTLIADERAVRQIMLNVLSNAIKFTPDGGRILMKARIAVDGEMIITVSDTGIGIPADQLPHVVGAFRQGSDVYTSENQGVGLGLYIVDKLMGLHGGRIVIESVVDAGTTISLIFPRARVMTDANVIDIRDGRRKGT